jgi:hypothetical protein
MRTSTLTALCAALLVAAPALAASPAIDQIVADAQKVRENAEDVKLLLKHRAADPATLLQRLGVIDTHARSLKAAIAEVRTSDTSLTSTEVAAVERAHAAAEALLVLLANKTAILADATTLDKQRRLLRDKAGAIAQRALLVEQQMERLRG